MIYLHIILHPLPRRQPLTMKVALLLTGYMRKWEDHYPSIYENIIQKYNPDIFISSYTYSELYKGSEIVQVDYEKVIETYKPKDYIFRTNETLPEFLFKKNGIEQNGREWSYRILKQWYTIYLGSFLFHPEEYDITIKTRTDFSMRNLLIKPDKNLVIPAWKVHPGPCEPENSYVDYFAYGKGSYMKKFLRLYEKMQELHNNDWGDVSIGELIIKSYVDRYIGNQNVTLDYDIDWLLQNDMWATEIRELHKRCAPETLIKVPATEKDAYILNGNHGSLHPDTEY